MLRHRIFTLLVSTLTAVSLLAATSEQPTGEGTVSTTLTLADLDLAEVPALGDIDAALGQLLLGATTVDGSEALIGFDGLRVGSESVASWRESSNEGTQQGSVDHSVGDETLGASVELVDYVVDAGDDHATAALSALSGRIDMGPLGLSADLGDRGTSARVTRTEAAGSTVVSVDGLQLDLGDLLPADILSNLPLGVVLDLIEGLELPLDGDLSAAVELLRELIQTLTDIEGVLNDIREARDELRALLADVPEVAGAEETLAAAEAALADALADLAEAQIAVEEAVAAVAEAEADLAAATAAVEAIEEQLEPLQAQITQLESDLALVSSLTLTSTDLLTVLQEIESRYGDDADCASVSSLLTPTQLLAIADCYEAYLATELEAAEAEESVLLGQLVEAEAVEAAAAEALAAAQSDLADAEAVLAAAESAVEEAKQAVADANAALDAAMEEAVETVLDSDLGRQLLATIEELRETLLTLLDELEGILTQLPDLSALLEALLQELPDAPILGLGRMSFVVDVVANGHGGTAVAECEVDAVEILGDAVPAATCDDVAEALEVVDGLLADVLAALPVTALPPVTVTGPTITTSSAGPDADGVSSAVVELTGLQLSVPTIELTGVVDDLLVDLRALVEEALATLDLSVLETFESSGDLEAFQVDAGLQGLLADLAAQLDALPTGELLDGLRTLGIDLTLGGLRSEALFQTSAAGPGGPGDGDPGDGAPGDGGPGDGGPGDGGPGDGGPAPAPDPGDDGPTSPAGPTSPQPNLPRTGGGNILAGLAMMMIAGTLAAWKRVALLVDPHRSRTGA